MDAETLMLVRSVIVAFLAAGLAPWLTWRLRGRLGWAVRVVDWVAGW